MAKEIVKPIAKVKDKLDPGNFIDQVEANEAKEKAKQ